ncbi:hypothetical protein GCM10011335_16750 [Aureimonas glaciei]|uniref:Uncharacterized protein n=1 Tax=Aureimonas glaciei TaxID=1776957 RepID=A0A917D9B8_9HYPH|nr:hypothetical protein GCM10011335_16750 [Aureimonas glaciei]
MAERRTSQIDSTRLRRSALSGAEDSSVMRPFERGAASDASPGKAGAPGPRGSAGSIKPQRRVRLGREARR